MTDKSPARSSKKKRTPQQVCADEIVERMRNTPISTNQETVGISKALHTIRIYNIKHTQGIDGELLGSINRVKEKILRLLVDEVVQSDKLTLADITTIMDVISLDFSIIPLWEHENMEFVEKMIVDLMVEVGGEENEECMNINAQDVLKALTKKSCAGDGEE